MDPSANLNLATDEEYDSFMQRVEEISSILKGLNSKDPDVAQKAERKADLYLHGTPNAENFSEDGLAVKTNKTIINQNAFKDEVLDGPSATPDAFMAYVERDAKKRYEDKRQRREISDRYKKDGNKAYKEGDYEKALDLYNKAIEQIKDSCVLYTNRAITCLNLQLYKRAISDCDWALKLNENSLKAWLFKARAHHSVGDHKQAKECLKQAQTRNPDHISYIKDYQDEWFTEKEL